MKNIKVIELESELLDLICKKGEIDKITASKKNYFVCHGFCLEKGNLYFILTFNNLGLEVQKDEDWVEEYEFDKPTNKNSEYSLQLYIDFIKSDYDKFEDLLTDKYADKVLNEKEALEFINYIADGEGYTFEEIYIDDSNELLNNFGVNLTVKKLDGKFKFERKEMI